ncbi:putative dithiobiotin synthetase [Klebsiella grimontii]|nr:putative dithiobiotin synthetase [Klebsiella grimontii]
MFKRFFITGTDTAVGKTVVSRALLQALAACGKSVAGYKPVAKGSKETPDGLRNKDALVLQSVSSLVLPYEAVNPIALSEDESSVRTVARSTTACCRMASCASAARLSM